MNTEFNNLTEIKIINNKDNNLEFDNNQKYFIPKNKNKDRLIKIAYEELLCPVLLNLSINFRCKYAKSKYEDPNLIFYCSANKCEHIVIKE